MEQRDLIKDQIEQLGKVLGRILASFFASNSSIKTEENIAISQVQLKEQLNLDIDEMILTSKDDLKIYCQKRKLTTEHLDTLANYLTEVGNITSSLTYYTTALNLLDIADEVSRTTTFERTAAIRDLKIIIEKTKK